MSVAGWWPALLQELQTVVCCACREDELHAELSQLSQRQGNCWNRHLRLQRSPVEARDCYPHCRRHLSDQYLQKSRLSRNCQCSSILLFRCVLWLRASWLEFSHSVFRAEVWGLWGFAKCSSRVCMGGVVVVVDSLRAKELPRLLVAMHDSRFHESRGLLWES